MDNFSASKYVMEQFAYEVEQGKQLKAMRPALPFSKTELTKKKQQERIDKALIDFWYFDKTYFSENMYEQYAAPNKMLKQIVKASLNSGYHLFLGPRKHGKTITAKKLLLWLTLTGKVKIAGVYSETINKSAAILKDLYKLCINNDRLLYDFDIKFQEANSDSLAFTSKLNQGIDLRFIASFSEGRSVKGYTRIFGRPTFLLGDDIETNESSFSAQSVRDRVDKLAESYHSMNDNSTFLILANDFNTSSAVHLLRMQYEQNLLPKNFNVYVYKAWAGNKPLWFERYKAKTESELKAVIQPLSESDWQANFQQNPIPPEGDFFKRDLFSNYVALPPDARGIVYCDPNLSKKSMGNTTAIVPLLYSPANDLYYVPEVVCKSFSDSNALIDSLLQLKNSYKNIQGIAFDGNVTQESTWSQHIRNYCQLKGFPIPLIEYKRYRVNDLAKNLQLAYAEGKIKFAPDFFKTVDGERFLSQFYAFAGTKKDGASDDAPDALICAFEFIHERRLVKRTDQPVTVFKDYYQL